MENKELIKKLKKRTSKARQKAVETSHLSYGPRRQSDC